MIHTQAATRLNSSESLFNLVVSSSPPTGDRVKCTQLKLTTTHSSFILSGRSTRELWWEWSIPAKGLLRRLDVKLESKLNSGSECLAPRAFGRLKEDEQDYRN